MKITTFGTFGKKNEYKDVIKVEIELPANLVITQDKDTLEVVAYIGLEECNSLLIEKEGE